MTEHVLVTGIVIKAEPVGDYDRRVVILTTDRGKITAFARGARKPNSRFVAGTNPFCFGRFYLYEGRNSYSINEVEIDNYFEELRDNFTSAYYGMYFLEIADYYTRENNDEKEMLKLVYTGLRALTNDSLSRRLVRAVFELKAVIINGEFPGIPANRTYSDSAVYTVEYIVNSRVEKLYTFTLKEEVLAELIEIAGIVTRRIINYTFKSLEILETLE